MKQSYLQLAILAALAAPIHAMENMVTTEGIYELVASTAGVGIATDAAGAALTSATAVPFYLVADDNCQDGYRTMVRPGFPGVVEAKLHSTAGSIVKGSYLILHTDGTLKIDPGTGARLVVAVAQEAKAAESQLLKVRLLGTPVAYAS
jgi:hypothetical protein